MFEGKKKMSQESEESVRNIRDTIKQAHNMSVSEEEKKRPERLFKETMAENFSNLKKYMDLQIQEDRVGYTEREPH